MTESHFQEKSVENAIIDSFDILKGRKKTKAHKQAVLDALNTKEVKDKISATWANKPKVTCPHCGVVGTQGHNMNRYHFNNCKGLR